MFKTTAKRPFNPGGESWMGLCGLEQEICMGLIIVLLVRATDSLCSDHKPTVLMATMEKQILNVRPAPDSGATDSRIVCRWEVQSAPHHGGLVLQVLDLDVAGAGDSPAEGTWLEVRGCDEDGCPGTCGDEYDPEEEVGCHQWCDEAGPEEEFRTDGACVAVTLAMTAPSQRGLLLSYASIPEEVLRVSPARMTLANYILFLMSGLTFIGVIICVFLIWANRNLSFNKCKGTRKARIILVAPAEETFEL